MVSGPETSSQGKSLPVFRWPRTVMAAALVMSSACVDDTGPYFGTTDRKEKELTTLHVNNSSEPEYLDPGKCSDSASGALVVQMFEGLSVYDARTGQPTPGVAERFELSPDNRFYRFHLRKDARWSDGSRVTAHDFVYAWGRVLTPTTASRVASILYPLRNAQAFSLGQLKSTRAPTPIFSGPSRDRSIGTLADGQAVRIHRNLDGFSEVSLHQDLPTFAPSAPTLTSTLSRILGFVATDTLVSDPSVLGVRATDNQTLEVELADSTPYFLELTAYTALAPVPRARVEAFEKQGKPDLWTRPENIIVNGPYILDEWRFRYEITLKRNPHYHDRDRLRVHNIVFTEVEDAQSVLNLYQTGELDYLGDNSSLPTQYLEILGTKKDFRRAPSLATYWFTFNVKQKPVDDVRVRNALNLAIDKQLLVDRVTRGSQIPAEHYVPPYTGSGYAEALKRASTSTSPRFPKGLYGFNPERARELMAQAGYPVAREGDGYRAQSFPALEVLYNTSEGHRRIAVAMQDMWKRHLGISASLRNEEWKVMLSNLQEGNFQIVRMGWVADYNHPQTWMDLFLSYSPQNNTGWADPTFDHLIESARKTGDPDKSMDLFLKAEERALAGMSRLPLYFYTSATLVKPWVRGLFTHPRGVHLLKWLWIDKDWQDGQPNVPSYEVAPYPAPGVY
jgi:oligopeptide transport system substrate-binding protein